MLSKIARGNPDKELLILGFVITNSEAYAKLRMAWKKQAKAGRGYLGISSEETKKITSDMLGGELLLLDPSDVNGEILARVAVQTPMGLYYDERRGILFVGSDKVVHGISNGKVECTIENKLFNCIHGLSGASNGNLIVTSTGIDAIIEIDGSNFQKAKHVWLATENGYDQSVNGNSRFVDASADYRYIEYSTPEHTVHVNSAIELDENFYLATFFHQGQLVKINKNSGKVEVLLSELKQPHNIRRSPSGYILSDTNGPFVLELDKGFNIVRKIKGDFNWIQDAVSLESGNIAIADANNGSVKILDGSGFVLSNYYYGENQRRIGVLSTIKAENAILVFCS